MPLSRNYAKVCDVADWQDDELVRTIAEIAPDMTPDRRHRKGWEFAMAALFLRDVGRLGSGAEVLDVAAGSDAIAFWLTRHAARVLCIDIYGEGDFGQREATATMLSDPAALAPYPYEQDRLEVRSMDARTLAFPDASFDVVVSFSSIEHFGTMAQISQSAREIGRVLRPGGHAYLTTEVYLDRHWSEHAPVHFAFRVASLNRRARRATLTRRTNDVFTERDVIRRVVEPSGLELMQPLDLTISPASFENVIEMTGSDARSTTGREFPHIVLRTNRSHFTSLGLPLVKPA